MEFKEDIIKTERDVQVLLINDGPVQREVISYSRTYHGDTGITTHRTLEKRKSGAVAVRVYDELPNGSFEKNLVIRLKGEDASFYDNQLRRAEL